MSECEEMYAFLSYTQCSQDRLWMHHEPNPTAAVKTLGFGRIILHLNKIIQQLDMIKLKISLTVLY